ncbi:Orexin receptor type 2 [Eumeta japonica]|uniref:Orexin receptor type 2 n=1 Tax=Eumeta variegata TaxID=151549 RepID=A0A4C1YUM8_EUMVA|nr:Orexin receptor type 2 [Eumeta japonica]
MRSFIRRQWLFIIFLISKIRYCATVLNSAENGNAKVLFGSNDNVNNYISDNDNVFASNAVKNYDETLIQNGDYKHTLIKRTVDEEDDYLTEDFDKNKEENTDKEENVPTNDTDCVGAIEFCNMTRDEYVSMLNNYIYPQPYEWVLIGTHSIVFVIGLIGNALVCIAVYRNHSMRTVTNYFIVNLAAADFMVILFCLPPTVLWDVTETWFLGNSLCKILLYFQSVSVTVSVLTLTFISVDRWYAICFPLKFKSTTGRAKTAILIIWVFSLLFTQKVGFGERRTDGRSDEGTTQGRVRALAAHDFEKRGEYFDHYQYGSRAT